MFRGVAVPAVNHLHCSGSHYTHLPLDTHQATLSTALPGIQQQAIGFNASAGCVVQPQAGKRLQPSQRRRWLGYASKHGRGATSAAVLHAHDIRGEHFMQLQKTVLARQRRQVITPQSMPTGHRAPAAAHSCTIIETVVLAIVSMCPTRFYPSSTRIATDNRTATYNRNHLLAEHP
jgi:hypothetical protein